MHVDHDPYYRDRLTVRDLCYDFPEDEMYIDGLHAMQSHFYTHTQIAATDKEIDSRVYALYGLTEDEIKVIEE